MEPTTDNDNMSHDKEATSDNDNTPVVAPTDNDKEQAKRDKAERKRQKQSDNDKAKAAKRADKERHRQFKRERRAATKKALLVVAGRDINAVARWLLFVATTCVAVANGILSSFGLYHYGTTVQHLPPALAALVPVAVEGMTLSSISAIYILRHAGGLVRSYCWAVFAAAVVASIGGNVAYVGLTDNAKGVGVVFAVGASVQPLFLTLSMHMVILAMRHAEFAMTVRALMFSDATSDNDNQESDTTPAPTTDDTTPIPVGVGSWNHPTDNDKRQATERRKPRRQTTPGRYDKERQYATRRAAEGATNAVIYAEIVATGADPSRRNVERWTKPIRDNKGATK